MIKVRFLFGREILQSLEFLVGMQPELPGKGDAIRLRILDSDLKARVGELFVVERRDFTIAGQNHDVHIDIRVQSRAPDQTVSVSAVATHPAGIKR